ncbi:GntR family transcriptional regulator [Candidatus Formimonas warabiya]|uniref:HTH gntR-type domain-containing protein n=1 Tax=Formimonas warabiya TaxID=1761012 RepID=A0A3G1L040_FORW1|nr:GntR family transcriptional regulator [Candidatus Formimonas warabiya]ATW28152.1 hypothetical protein DCMF_28395 [Candidatus Formimonas warabiya]
MNTRLLKDEIFDLLASKIQSGDLLPNQRITEESLANEMGISRTPVREALIRLAADNLLVKIPRKGFFIKDFTKKEKLEKYEIMGALDGLVGSLAATRLSDEDILRMEELVELIDVCIKYRNWTKYQALVAEFHDAYTKKCGNDSLIKLVRSLQFNFVPNKYISNDDEKLAELQTNLNNDHRELIKCFMNRDAAAAEMVLRKHWKTDENYI